MITNDTIIKAAQAAGLDVQLCLVTGKPALADMKGGASWFDPIYNDTDNAMIRRGAEIDVMWWKEYPDRLAEVQAKAWIEEADGDLSDIDVTRPYKVDKDQAEREAVILCAAAKWDAMQGEQK